MCRLTLEEFKAASLAATIAHLDRIAAKHGPGVKGPPVWEQFGKTREEWERFCRDHEEEIAAGAERGLREAYDYYCRNS